MTVGETFLADEPIEINAGRRTTHLRVANTGDRPIQVGSHYHFFEANRALHFDRPAALGMHLAIPAGAAVRFEPGDERDVNLVEYGGMKRMLGFNGLVNGGLTSSATRRRALANAKAQGYLDSADRSGDQRRDSK
ncbi:urease subunit beta [Streptomyces sp. NPDC052043]|uniref:urease subunit beta n=1 Tax=Streptomyces sp. NPDC052043 TaxID=3365684 RepID=UPI0037D095E2